MNNPFASNRNIFNNIVKPPKPEDKGPLENGAGSAVSSNTVQFSNANKYMSNTDLNFRGQFRTVTANPMSDMMPDAKRLPSAAYDPQPLANGFSTRHVSDRQYAPYGSISAQSSGPSISLPASNAESKFSGHNVQPTQSKSAGQPQDFTTGVERQKITFGVGSVSNPGTKIEYDRGKFVNRQEMVSGINYSSSGHQGYSEPPTRKIHLEMSPIQEHSKHKIDDIELLDIEAMGDDIQKILASSKNQEELCRLLGIDNVAAGRENRHSSNSQARSNSLAEPPDHSNWGAKTLGKKGSLPEPPGHQHSYGYEEKEKDEEVFNYQVQNPVTMKIGNQGLKNTGTLSNANEKGTSSGYSVELQQAIDREMKKLSEHGRTRIFLSASDKIETVKYNLQFI